MEQKTASFSTLRSNFQKLKRSQSFCTFKNSPSHPLDVGGRQSLHIPTSQVLNVVNRWILYDFPPLSVEAVNRSYWIALERRNQTLDTRYPNFTRRCPLRNGSYRLLGERWYTSRRSFCTITPYPTRQSIFNSPGLYHVSNMMPVR